MRKVDFFIVGAPKCGTTALADFLEQHPGISLLPKEIHHFGSDLEFRRPRIDAAGYQAKIDALPEGNLVCDASVHYLYSEKAAEDIHSYNPAAKIIIMLRQPVDMLYSLHGQMLKTADEEITDFAAALAAEEGRRQGVIPMSPAIHAVHAYQYMKIADYPVQIKRYFDVFGKDKVKTYLQEDLQNQPEQTYKDCLEFIGATPDFTPEFKQVNAARIHRFPAIRKFLKNIDREKRDKIKDNLPGFLRSVLAWVYTKLFFTKHKRGPIDPDLRKSLTEQMEPVINNTAKLIGRDLSHWLEEKQRKAA